MKQIYLNKLTFLLLFTFTATALFSQVFVKHDATGTGDGTSWANAHTELKAAINNTSSDELWIAAGTYNPGGQTADPSLSFLIDRNLKIYGGFAGTESSLDERNPAANETIISGDLSDDDLAGVFDNYKSDNSLHVIVVDGPITNPVVIDGISVIGGHTIDDGDLDVFERIGGGIYALNPVNISNCKFYNNFGRSGGSVFLAPNASGSTVEDCDFTENYATEQSAGLFALGNSSLTVRRCSFANNETNRGSLYPSGCNNVLIDSCAFINNNNSVGFGAGMFVWQNTNFTLSNSTFTANSANSAAGIYIDGRELSLNPDNVNVKNCEFSLNEAVSGSGGGLSIFAANATVEDCSFLENFASGGAAHLSQSLAGKNIIVRGCAFEDAECGGWGGAATCYGLDAECLFEDCSFEGNQTANLGGAVNCGFGAIATFDGCVFNENESLNSAGGAIGSQNDSTTIIVLNSEFTNNKSGSVGGAVFAGATSSSGIIVVDGSSFFLNESGGSGGAIFLAENGDDDISTLTLSNSTFIFNIATDQGGAVNLGDSDATITSCLFAANDATGLGTGGAISINSADSNHVEVLLMNNTFADNSGNLSAGIANWTGGTGTSNTTVQNCIFRQNSLVNYIIEDGTPTLISNGGNMFDDVALVNEFSDPSDQHGVDPDFTNSGDFEYFLNDGSPAIDAGINAGAPEFDLEGNPRINTVDLGAYENQNVTDIKETILENNGMLTVAPNPVRGSFTNATLSNQWSGDVQVRLFNSLGQSIRSMELTKTSERAEFQFDLKGINTGVYQMVVSNGQQAVVARLIRI